MKNKLKEMLLKHKPISEETSDIDDIWGDTVTDGAENFEEIPEGGTPQEDETVVDAPVEEYTEENKHIIAYAIKESFLIPNSLKMKYHNSRIKANTKNINKKLDKIEEAGDRPANHRFDWYKALNKLKGKVEKTVTKLDSHTDKYKEAHDKKQEKLAEKTPPATVPEPHQKVASNAAAAKERLSKLVNDWL